MSVTTTLTPADVLRRAAWGFRAHQIDWGPGWFLDPHTGCRCALGGIAWAVDPSNEDGNPFFVSPALRVVAEVAVQALADHLIEEHGVPACRTDGAFDPVETVGGYNDQDDMIVDRIIAALEAAAERAEA